MSGKIPIHKNPWPESEVIGEITDSTEITIDKEESTYFFYKVCTAFGAEGFCMKRLITDKN